MLKALKKVDWFLEAFQKSILIVSSVVMVVLIVTSAVLRYLFQTNIFGNEEMIIFAAFWMYFIGGGYAEGNEKHIMADFLVGMCTTKRSQNIMYIVQKVASLVILVIVNVWCFQMLIWDAKWPSYTSNLRISFIWYHLPVVIGYLLWTYYDVKNLVRAVGTLKEGL